MKIEILGNAKTGTTGVFNSIRLPLRERDPQALLLFEPRSSSLYRIGRHPVPFSVLAKAMINRNHMNVAYATFTHHVLISRDPRDTLVSHLLYLPLQPHAVRAAGKQKLDRLIRALREKEADPASTSFRDLFTLAIKLMHSDKDWSWEKYLDRFDTAERLRDAHDWFVLRYDDFIENRLDALSAYLALDVKPIVPESVDTWNGHVVRSASHGEWRNWFVPSDVEFFQPLLKRYMDTFGYDDDWSVAAEPVIPSATASGYVLARRPVVEAKMERRFATTDDWNPESVVDASAAEAIRLVAEDSGAGVYGYRYAVLLLEGRVVPRDPERAFSYAYRAALVGNLAAMVLVADMFRTGLGTTADVERARAWEHEAEVLRTAPKATATGKRAAARLVRKVKRLVRPQFR